MWRKLVEHCFNGLMSIPKSGFLHSCDSCGRHSAVTPTPPFKCLLLLSRRQNHDSLAWLKSLQVNQRSSLTKSWTDNQKLWAKTMGMWKDASPNLCFNKCMRDAMCTTGGRASRPGSPVLAQGTIGIWGRSKLSLSSELKTFGTSVMPQSI